MSLLVHWIVMTTEPTCVCQKEAPPGRLRVRKKWSQIRFNGSRLGGHWSGRATELAA